MPTQTKHSLPFPPRQPCPCSDTRNVASLGVPRLAVAEEKLSRLRKEHRSIAAATDDNSNATLDRCAGCHTHRARARCNSNSPATASHGENRSQASPAGRPDRLRLVGSFANLIDSISDRPFPAGSTARPARFAICHPLYLLQLPSATNRRGRRERPCRRGSAWPSRRALPERTSTHLDLRRVNRCRRCVHASPVSRLPTSDRDRVTFRR